MNIYPKIRCKMLMAVCMASLSVWAQHTPVWQADLGNGKYRNPVLYADYSDPDVCAVGEDFYLTASSFACAPGLPVLHSTDLINWELVSYAISKVPNEVYDKACCNGKGVWAPSIRYHEGKVYIYWADPDYGVYMTNTTDPRDGEWSEPILVKAASGIIDPCVLWDDDGRCYMAYAWAASRAGVNSVICVAELDADGTKVIGMPRIVFDGNDNLNHTSEGPKFYKRNGYYYLFFPAGGVEQGWQMAARATHPYGPYEARRVMEQGNTRVNGPHQGGWVQTTAGEDWFIHFQDAGCYGRVAWLEPMHWVNNWPVIGNDPDLDGTGNPVQVWRKPQLPASADAVIECSDDFDEPAMGMQWQWSANFNDLYGFTTPYGYMRLYTWPVIKEDGNLWRQPNMLLQKFSAPAFTVTAKVKVSCKNDGQEAGLIVMGRSYSALTLCYEHGRFALQHRQCTDAHKGGRDKVLQLNFFEPTWRETHPYSPATGLTMYLRVRVDEGGKCTFSYSTDGKTFEACGQEFQAVAGQWVGARVGLVAFEPPADKGHLRGWMDVDYFRVTPNQ